MSADSHLWILGLDQLEGAMVGGEDLGRPGPGGDDGGVKNVEKEITLRERSTTDFSKEPLLTDNPNRFVILPIQYYDDIWRMYKQAQASFWTAKEVDLEMVSCSFSKF